MARSSDRPPVRLVHLGLGNFFRSHQVPFTASAPDGTEWGYAAFGGRAGTSPTVEAMAAQNGRYHLIERRPDGDGIELMDAVVAAHPGDDQDALNAYLSSSAVGAVTLTITEAGYSPDSPTLARLLGGLDARRSADGGPITLIPCDNLPANGTVLREILVESARQSDPGFLTWFDDTVTVASTVVDRITPATTDPDRAWVLERTGTPDQVPVVTEPFREWVLDRAPGCAPDWTAAGAVVADDLAPYANRKLWLLNGAHSILAYTGLVKGLVTVADAVEDAECRRTVEDWWASCRPHLLAQGGRAEDLDAYERALVERFTNPRMDHRLAQIAVDGSQKLPVRIVPVLRLERDDGRVPMGAVRVFGAWITRLRADDSVADARADDLHAAVRGPAGDAVRRVLTLIDAHDLADDRELVDAIASQVTN